MRATHGGVTLRNDLLSFGNFSGHNLLNFLLFAISEGGNSGAQRRLGAGGGLSGNHRHIIDVLAILEAPVFEHLVGLVAMRERPTISPVFRNVVLILFLMALFALPSVNCSLILAGDLVLDGDGGLFLLLVI